MKEQNETLNCLKALCSFMANAPYVEVFPQHIRQSALPDDFYQFYRHADGGIGYIPPYRGHSLAGVPERQILLYTISRMAEKNREMRNLAKEIYLDCDPLREQEKLNKEETLRLNQFFDNCVIWGEVFDDPYDPDYLVISNTMAIWDSRGWYNKAYSSVVNSGQCTKIYENDSWAVLQINHEWSEPNKSSERYWVHKLTVPESSETGRNN